MKNSIFTYFILPLLLLAVISGCSKDDIMMQAGKLPDEAAMEGFSANLTSNLSFSGERKIELTKQNEAPVLVDELYYKLSQAAQSEQKLAITIENEMSEEFLKEIKRQNDEITEYNRTNYQFPKPLLNPSIFPAKNVLIEGGNSLSVAAGENSSTARQMLLSSQELSCDSIYELLLSVEKSNKNNQVEKQYLRYTVKVFQKAEDMMAPRKKEKVVLDTQFLTVFYLNTESYQPLLADIFMYQKKNNNTFKTEAYCSLGNIVNLRTVTVAYDKASKRALLSLGNDLRYVLEHANKYIRPLQDHGRKVCLSIENGGKGIGFCNMNDSQIADFARQVKETIDYYRLDGLNLRDNEMAYGKEGIPPMNSRSYPKLIKALREALPDKLITLEDHGKPTEYFHDVQLCGGIEVGKYIDYAWHGYVNEDENVQIIEPWEADHPYSEYTRKPIAGLSPERYGSVNIPRYPGNTGEKRMIEIGKRAIFWKKDDKRKKNNIIVFGNDLIGNEQNQYESSTENMLYFINQIADDGSIWGQNEWAPHEWGEQSGDYSYNTTMTDGHRRKYKSNYRYLAKDW